MTWAIVTGMAIGAVVGGGSAALQKKDILQGALMGGVTGAVSGGIGSLAAAPVEAGVASGVGDAGFGALTNTGSVASGVNAFESALPGTAGSIGGVGAMAPMAGASTAPMGLASAYDTALTGAGSNAGQAMPTPPSTPSSNPLFANPMKYLGDNKMSIGLAGLAGSMAPNASQPNTGQEDVTIHPYTYSAGLNPGYTGAGTPYFNQHYNALPTYTAKEGGIMRLASGGNAVDAYNAKLMNNAQQEYVNSPQLGAFRSHFNDPIANASSTNDLYQQYLNRPADPTGIAANQYASPAEITRSILSSPEYLNANPGAVAPAALTGPLAFDPVSHRYVGTAAAAAAATTPNTPVQATGDNQVGAGQANGGLMGYAMGGGIGSYYPSPDDGQGGQHPQDTMMGAHPSVSMGPAYPMQGIKSSYATGGGIYNLGGYSDGGRLLKGPGDGVSDDIPAQIGAKQPARLADGEFVVPARIVSELGNGSTDAGAKRLYAMMDRVQANRRKTVGKGKVAVNSNSDKYLPA